MQQSTYMAKNNSHIPSHAGAPTEEVNKLWAILEDVLDPEVPVLSIVDLGVVRNVIVTSTDHGVEVSIDITPTYSGCPAMDMIAMNIRIALLQQGYKQVKLNTVLSPAWTTDWMSESGKQKLQAYGISPPVGKAFNEVFLENLRVECPLCRSNHTRLVSQFGSTSCKALFQCDDCKEPFDYFKCH